MANGDAASVTTPFVSFELPAYYFVNARLGYRVAGDRLELGIVGYNITNHEHRQHPFGQKIGARVLGTVAARF